MTRSLLVYVLAIILVIGIGSEAPALLVSEFLANNGGSYRDADGESSDWIELWNSSDSLAELEGYFLTDDPSQPDQWALPSLQLDPDEHLIVFASAKSRNDPAGELHTNFRLNRAGGSYLALNRSNGDGFEIVSVFDGYPRQREGISFGIFEDGAEPVEGFFLKPSPGKRNAVSPVSGFVADTEFSVNRGYYHDPFTTVLSSATPGATLIYTLDGSLPTVLNGIKVEAVDDLTAPRVEIPISTTTTLRALGRKAGFQETNVDTHSYLFPSAVLGQSAASVPSHVSWGHAGPDYEMDPAITEHADPEVRPAIEDFFRIPTVSLVTEWDGIFGTDGIYIAGEGVERQTSIEYLNPEGSLDHPNEQRGFQVDGTVQVVGGESADRWRSDKLSMRLKFSPDLRYPVFGTGRAQHFDTLVLDHRNANVWHFGTNFGGQGAVEQRDAAQYTRDQFPANLHQKMGGLSPTGRHVFLYINGVFWGVSELHERPDDNFAAEYLGGDNEDYDVIKHRSSTVVQGSSVNYKAMLELGRKDMSIPANFQAVEQVLDIENFIDYMIANYYVGNFDWGNHNWYASFNKVDQEGRWRYHSWDAEHCLEATNHDVTWRNDAQGPTGLFRNLIENPVFRLRFGDAAHEHFFNDGLLTPSRAAEAYLELANPIEHVVRLESARWGDNQRFTPYTRLDWLQTRDELLGKASGSDLDNYFPLRTGVVLSQFRSLGWYPGIDAPRYSQHGGNVPIGFRLAISSPGEGTVHYTLDGSDPRTSPTSTVYQGEIPLTEIETIVTACVDSGIEWSTATRAVFQVGAVPASHSNLAISKIHYRPAAPNQAERDAGFLHRREFEFVEFVNVGENPIDLSEVKFEAGVGFKFGEGLFTVLVPGERVVLVANRAAFQFRYGDEPKIVGEFDAGTNLSNSGERLRLVGHEGRVIHDFTYDDEAPWPNSADGDGYALTLVSASSTPDPTLPINWRASVEIGGSPGQDDGVTYSDWALGTGAGSALADPNGDGVTNLEHYRFGGDPLKATDSMRLPRIRRVGLETFVEIFLNKEADQADWTIRTSIDGVNWKDASMPELKASSRIDLGDGTELRSFVWTEEGPQLLTRVRLFRIRVSLRP